MAVAALPLIISAVGAGVSAYSSIQGGLAQSSAAAYQAQVAKNNATIAQQNARYATTAVEIQASERSQQAAATQGRIRTAIAANGVDVNTGSASDVQSSQRQIGQLDTENVMQSALLNAYGYRTQAAGYSAQSALDTAQSSQAVEGGILSGVGGLLGSAGSIGTKWLGAQTPSPTSTASKIDIGDEAAF